MKKFELIRGIFNIVMREGFDDNKQDAISEYTKDKMQNIVYVKKLNLNNYMGVESVAITSLEYDFSDVCDSDLRVAIENRNIGKRIIVYANELDYNILDGIYTRLKTEYSASIEEKNYNILNESLRMEPVNGQDIKVNRQALSFVLALYRKAYIDNK